MYTHYILSQHNTFRYIVIQPAAGHTGVNLAYLRPCPRPHIPLHTAADAPITMRSRPHIEMSAPVENLRENGRDFPSSRIQTRTSSPLTRRDSPFVLPVKRHELLITNVPGNQAVRAGPVSIPHRLRHLAGSQGSSDMLLRLHLDHSPTPPTEPSHVFDRRGGLENNQR